MRQKVVAYLGSAPTIAEAIERKEKRAEQLRKWLAEDYDERTYRCFFTGRVGKQLHRELKGYSTAYSRKYSPLPRDGATYGLIDDALAAIKGEKTVPMEYWKPGATRPVRFSSEHPRIEFMLCRYQQAKEKHFTNLQRGLKIIDEAIDRLRKIMLDS